MEACFWPVYIRGICFEKPLNTLIDFFNFFFTENCRVIEICTKEFAKNPVPIVEIDIAVSISLISQPSHGANQFALDCSGLPRIRNQIIPYTPVFCSPSLLLHLRFLFIFEIFVHCNRSDADCNRSDGDCCKSDD